MSKLPKLQVGDHLAISVLRPDAIIDLTGYLGEGLLPEQAVHGIWFFDFLGRVPGSAGIAPLRKQEPVTRFALFRSVATDGTPKAIAAAALNTKFVAALNEHFIQEKCASLLLRELCRAQVQGRPGSEPDVVFNPPVPPTLGDLLVYLAGMAGEGCRRIGDKALTLLRLRPGMFFLKSSPNSLSSFQPGLASRHLAAGNEYYADPFLWEHQGEMFCFFEVYDYKARRGHIAVGRLADGKLHDVRDAVKADYHLSFPFVFSHENQLFMLPETCEKLRLEVWRCVEFPDRWERHTIAMEGVCAADSMLYCDDGKWWLFTNISTDPFGDMNSELHLFEIDGPEFKTVKPHPLNPVIFDSRSARNAGRVMNIDGRLFRPAQDNSHGTYGYGINLMEILELSADGYREGSVRSFKPDFEKGLIGCHHLDFRSGTVVMDARASLGGFA